MVVKKIGDFAQITSAPFVRKHEFQKCVAFRLTHSYVGEEIDNPLELDI